MILLREAREADLDAFEKFSHIPGMFNIPSDRELLRERILHSQRSFRGTLQNRSESKFIFVAEELETQRVVGTSMIASQHGTAEAPHFYFQVGTEKRYSKTINTGFLHGTLTLQMNTDGPSELGGLVVDPEVRNSPDRVGRQISFIRFLFVALHRELFKATLLAELLPPLNKRGQSPLWEAIGRRFTNMDYWEADRLCQKDKEFIFSLFPREKIYAAFLQAEARNAIGKVGKETEPVFHILTKIGFEYKNQIDPFDGGPHLVAEVDRIYPIQKTITGVAHFLTDDIKTSHAGIAGLITTNRNRDDEFRAISVIAFFKDENIFFDFNFLTHKIGIIDGSVVTFMPFYSK